ncbi:MAG TPA: tRNA lysidine(34) synthetase TilS [Flavobacteriales bacterium]|nr:tRNA lysidine(34) synthetase TilS [Flavobacteriales bacterium]
MHHKSIGNGKSIKYKPGLSKTFGNIKKQVADCIEGNKTGKKKFLLAVSGGADSVLLAHVFHALKLKFAIAHVNYSLRGKESHADAVFVKNLAKKLGVDFYYKKINTKKAIQKGQSVQMAAREIRYAFFEEILQEEKIDYMVLAHHASDQVETVLLKLFRGCGIDGLTGMQEKNSNKLRPMLGVPHVEIKKAVKEMKIAYRTDSSNLTSHYKRNFLRNEVMPLLKKKWPGLEQTLLRNIENFKAVRKLLPEQSPVDFTKPFEINSDSLINDPVLRESFIKAASKQRFQLNALKKLVAKKTTESKSLKGVGGVLEFKNNRIVYRPNNHQDAHTPIEPELLLKKNNVTITGYDAGFIKSRSERISKSSIKGQLSLKKWETGTKMVPLGMNGSKKISDILAGHKLSVSQKKNVYVLWDEEKPLWLLGLRIDNRVKLTGNEKESEILNLRIV